MDAIYILLMCFVYISSVRKNIQTSFLLMTSTFTVVKEREREKEKRERKEPTNKKISGAFGCNL